MFNLTHILYMVISVIVTAGLLTVCRLYIKTEKGKIAVLKTAAISTVILHYSSLWVDFLTTGEAMVESVMLFAIHPCNICMWILLVLSLCKKRNNTAYRLFSEGLFWVGTVCGFIGILLNENFGNNPTLADWDILKGLLSHSTMIFGTIYLLVGGFVKIRVFNVLSTTCVLLLFIVDGVLINGLYKAFNLSAPNSMYLQQAPFPAMPWLNTWTIGVTAIALVFAITALHELITLPKKERWYTKLKLLNEKRKGEQK